MSMSVTNNNLQKLQQQLSTGSRINSAADDAAGLAILEKLSAQERGLAQGTQNTATMQDLVRTAEGGLSNIADSLQRIRELSLQAANGILEPSDKAIIQNEISQLLEGIDQVAGTTEFNKKNLLDGSFTDMHTASYADGSGKSFSIPGMSMKALGIEGYSVMGEIDLEAIDRALDTVNSSRSQLGAISNSFDHVMNSNSITELNLAASRSRIADTDMAKASTEYNKNKIILEYQIMAQKRQQELEKNKMGILG